MQIMTSRVKIPSSLLTAPQQQQLAHKSAGGGWSAAAAAAAGATTVFPRFSASDATTHPTSLLAYFDFLTTHFNWPDKFRGRFDGWVFQGLANRH